MFYDLNSSKLPATTVRFMKIIIVSKRMNHKAVVQVMETV